MKQINSISFDSYCPRREDKALRKRLAKWIKESGAFIYSEGSRYVDIPKFDAAILRALDEERKRIQTEFDFRSAASHVAKTFDLLHMRYEFLYRIQDRGYFVKKIDATELKRQLKVASQSFGELADRLILAYELFFDAGPSKAEISDARGSFDEEQYYL